MSDNGYVVHAGNKLYGPYISYADAYRAMDKAGLSGFIKGLNSIGGSVIVDDCDRPECRHCRNMEREADKSFHKRKHEERMNDPEYKNEYEKMEAEL